MLSNNVTKNEAIELVKAINEVNMFSTYPDCDFVFYPFSNEKGYSSVIQQLNQNTHTQRTSDKLHIALLFGESHILSMLAPLARHADVVILADINQRLHSHTKHMLNCLHEAEDIDDFFHLYKKDNPFQIVKYNSVTLTVDDFVDHLRYSAKNMVGEGYCLSNEESFQANKKMVNLEHVTNIYLDLSDIHQCYKLAGLIKQFNGELTLCNFTNIHDYVSKSDLSTSVSALLEHSPSAQIIYSYGSSDRSLPELYLQAQLTDLSGYMRNALLQSSIANEKNSSYSQQNIKLFTVNNDYPIAIDQSVDNSHRVSYVSNRNCDIF